jgi:ASPM-SPD-2-Hydin domain-containing protein
MPPGKEDMHQITKLALAAAIVAATPLTASARSTYLSSFNSRYGTATTVLDDCQTCHGSGGTSTYNPYGAELRANIGSGISSALTLAEPKDSDSDGYTNLQEIEARSLPYDARSTPAPTTPAAPRISVAPTSLALGTVKVGTSASQTATVSNSGTADLTISAVSRCSGTSLEFSASPSGPFTVAPGGSQAVTVTYAPVDATTDGGCFAIANDDATAGTVQVSVSGTGQAQAGAVLDVDIARFSAAKRADLSRGGAVSPKVTVFNAGAIPGTATIVVEGTVLDATGAPAAVYSASQDVTVAAGATAKVTLPAWAPAAAAVVTWTATVADQDPDVDTATATTKFVP